MTMNAVNATNASPLCRPDSGHAAPAGKLQDAAQQFEALLVAQMLKSVSQADGWLGTGDDASASSAMEMAEEQFAQALASKGGLGLTKTIVSGLADQPDLTTPQKAETAAAAQDSSPLRAHTPVESDGSPPACSDSPTAQPDALYQGPGKM
jgi:Rod binding domain-containing protein